MSMIEKILMATDFSECSDHALEMALELAQREGAKVTMLHVCQPPAYVYASIGGMAAPSPELVAELLAEAEGQLADLEQRLASRGISVATATIEGEPRDIIPRFAAERGHDLIVVGSHGRRGFRRFFLGSVAEHVVRVAAVPVLVVHSRAEAASVESAP